MAQQLRPLSTYLFQENLGLTNVCKHGRKVWVCSSAWLERTPDKREVGGSSPPRPTSFASRYRIYNPGALAQLGERLLCKQEVTGSIPVGSTIFIYLPTPVGRYMKMVFLFETPIYSFCHLGGLAFCLPSTDCLTLCMGIYRPISHGQVFCLLPLRAVLCTVLT